MNMIPVFFFQIGYIDYTVREYEVRFCVSSISSKKPWFMVNLFLGFSSLGWVIRSLKFTNSPSLMSFLVLLGTCSVLDSIGIGPGRSGQFDPFGLHISLWTVTWWLLPLRTHPWVCQSLPSCSSAKLLLCLVHGPLLRAPQPPVSLLMSPSHELYNRNTWC